MTEENFKKGIEALKTIGMTQAEKSAMLHNVFLAPIESPYTRFFREFSYVYSSRVRTVMAVCLVFVLSTGGVAYASGRALPGDVLYGFKTKIVEPVLDVVNNISPEKKVAWEEKKIDRRLGEAEKLARDNKLNETNSKELERR